MPTYPHEKVISLPDISIYTEGGDVPLPDVLEKLYAKADGKAVDMKGNYNSFSPFLYSSPSKNKYCPGITRIRRARSHLKLHLLLKGIISITGKAGLYKLLSRGKNNLIVENITTCCTS